MPASLGHGMQGRPKPPSENVGAPPQIGATAHPTSCGSGSRATLRRTPKYSPKPKSPGQGTRSGRFTGVTSAGIVRITPNLDNLA